MSTDTVYSSVSYPTTVGGAVVAMDNNTTQTLVTMVTTAANTTRCGKMSSGFLAFVAFFYVFVIVVGIIGNCLIIAAFLMGPKLRRVTVNVIMVHMAVVNMVHVCVANPFALIKNYYPHLIENRYVNLTLYMAFWMCFNISLYNLVAISVNRYLLIAYPTTTFRRFCIGRAIGLSLGLIWLFAIVLHVSLALQLMFSSQLYRNREYEGDGITHLHHITPKELIMIYSLAIFLPPLIIIPVMHSLTLYTMRSSTRRVQKASDDPVLNRQLRAARGQTTTPSASSANVPAGGGIPLNMSSGSLLASNVKSELEEPRVTTTQLANQSLRALAIVIAPQASSSTLEMEQRSRDQQRSRTVKTSRCNLCLCLCKQAGDTGQQTSQRPRLGRQRGELRLIRLMMLVYLILTLTWVPTLVVMTDIFDIKEIQIHGLMRLGLLYPLFPSLVPYVYLWSNRNFQRALRRSLKKKTSSLRYKPAEQK